MTIAYDASIFRIPCAAHIALTSDQEGAAVAQALAGDMAITPRGAGTSLGGQAIGEGQVLDFRNCNRILQWDGANAQVVVEPGVIQADLNDFLKPYGCRFAPDTSTATRATIGGMIGNNSCGMYSCHWGTTREHVHRIKVQLSDGSIIWAEPLSESQLAAKCQQPDLEGHIYRTVIDLVSRHRQAIMDAYPDPSLVRRNTGYALDVLAQDYQPFNPKGKPFSLVPLLCGSEGTLAIFLQATLKTVPLPERRDLLCAHFARMDDAFACLPMLMARFAPAAVELLDAPTLQAAGRNPQQAANRFWLVGQPDAVFAIELFDAAADQVEALRQWLLTQGAYAVPHLTGATMEALWSLRRAGLGLLMGERTRKKAIAVVEDAAVPLGHLRNYYHDMRDWLAAHGIEAVFYGHASVGLIHIRPKLDLSQPEDRQRMVELAQFSAERVKHYRGALSGEHGDGRIRAPFLRDFFGEEVYQLNVAIKEAFDPHYRFNPGVIIGNAPITENLRADFQPQVEVDTGLDWSESLSLFDAVSQCNGAGACLKSPGRGVMCPSYQALRREDTVTRGRANLLREALAAPDPKRALCASALKTAMETCLACKACQTACPASVDMAALKMEWLYQTRPHRPVERWLLRHGHRLARWGQYWPDLANALQRTALFRRLAGVAPGVELPAIQAKAKIPVTKQADVLVWVDFTTQIYRPDLLETLNRLLQACGLRAAFKFSGGPLRLWLSQGLLDEARALMQQEAEALAQFAGPVVALEPAEALIWQDEARRLRIASAPSVQLVEEWLAGVLPLERLKPQSRTVWVHVHCHQKAAQRSEVTIQLLRSIPGLQVKQLETGCCGMAGDFGYRHPTIAHQVAQVGFLPPLQAIEADAWLVASGFSCQHQIRLLTHLHPLHPIEVLARGLK